MNAPCPGKKGFIKKAKDLPPGIFRRLVDRRVRQLIDPKHPASTNEAIRRKLEKELEKIHLQPNFLPASFLRDGAAKAKAVCRIKTRRSLGTGFLIAPGILMTNNHVLSSKDEAGDSVAEFGFEPGREMIIVPLQPHRLFMTHKELDFTIVACDGAPLSQFVPIPLLRSPATVTRHERVNIIQHPSGRPKEVALHDNHVTRIKDTVLHYRTDTEPGSSGSPVFNNEWDLVALHHAGFHEGGGKVINEGIRISAIAAHLLRRSRESSNSHEALQPILQGIPDSSPYLGFFDFHGVGDPNSLEVEIPDFTGTPDFADIGFWNIEHFNRNVSDERIESIADVVGRLSLDALGLMEVQEEALDRLVKALGRRGWAVDYQLLNVRGAQDLAVLYDTDTTTVNVRDDITQRNLQRLNAKTPGGKTAFPRHPLFAECVVRDGNNQEIRFLMMVVHLKAFGDSLSRARRTLASRMLAEIIQDIREHDNLPVVLGGDFNDRIDTNVFATLTDAPDLFAMTADDATTDAVSYIGGRHRSLIDHIIVSRDVRLGEIAGDDTAIVRLDRSVRDFADTVSDHVPLVFRMVYRGRPILITPEETGQDIRISIPEGASTLEMTFTGN